MQSPLVSTEWLHDHLNDHNLVIIQATISKIIGKEPLIYSDPVHIPNAFKVDIEDDLSDLTLDVVHAFPSEQQFNALSQRLGICRDHTIVIYDDQGIYAAPRIWWIFKSFGVENVFILDGGLPKWLKENKPSTTEYRATPEIPSAVNFSFNSQNVCSLELVKQNILTKQFIVVDARAAERFSGLVPEPRPGVRSGHIPNAINLPFGQVIDDICYKSPEILSDMFDAISHDKFRPLSFSCGSGVTGCIILVAAIIAGRSNVSLYDGSWSEWGSIPTLPVEL